MIWQLICKKFCFEIKLKEALRVLQLVKKDEKDISNPCSIYLNLKKTHNGIVNSWLTSFISRLLSNVNNNSVWGWGNGCRTKSKYILNLTLWHLKEVEID